MDPANNEIYIPIDAGTVLVFDRTANGDVAPKRILGGPDTQIRGVSAVAVDPIHNILAVNSGGAMLIFDRTASGNTKPKAVIRVKSKSTMANISSFQTHAPKGLIIAGCEGVVAAASLFAPGASMIMATLRLAGKFRFDSSRDSLRPELLSIRLIKR